MAVNTKTISPFKSIIILPSFGRNTATITWTLDDPAINDVTYNLKIEKSKDGYTDWFELDLEDPITGYKASIDDGYFIDSNLGYNTQVTEWHYRINLENKKTNKILRSNPTTYRHQLEPIEFGSLREVISQEFNSGDFIPMLLYRPLTNKENPMQLDKLSTVTNPLTGQVIGTATDLMSYGKTYKQGYSKPILVYITPVQTQLKHVDLGSGHGTVDNKIMQFKTFAYPKFYRGDLIIDVISDTRYFFDNIISIEKFKGVIPMFFVGQMTQISRNDIAYKVPVSECAIEAIRNIK